MDLRGVGAVFASGRRVGPLDLRVADGEHVLIVGPSGSGKSTVLQLVHRAIPTARPAHATGEGTVAGIPWTEAEPADLADQVGVVFQDPATGVCLGTVDEEVALPLELREGEARLGDARVSAALDLVGAGHLLGRRTGRLSGGEAQRVALAAAVVAGPRLILLDEPTSMLDGDGLVTVRGALVRVADGRACVLVEHRLDELAGRQGSAALPARWIVLDPEGGVRYDGPVAGIDDEVLLAAHRDGCWLPWDLEERVLDLLGVLDHPAPPSPSEAGDGPHARGARPPTPGAVVLRAAGLVVDTGGYASRRGRRRRATGHRVLDGVDLSLHAGELVALIGRNGSGKSTLLHTLAGVRRPDAGTVAGEPVGMVFQNPEHQFVATSVRGEIAHGLDRTLEESRRDAAVDRTLAAFGLGHLADTPPHRLSGGEKRRLSLAAMSVHGRRVLLADEPTFGLDRVAVRHVLRSLRATADAGGAILVATHDLRTVLAHADRVLVLDGGVLVADGDPREVLTDPEVLGRCGQTTPPFVDRLSARVGPERLPAELRRLEDTVAASLPTGRTDG